MSNTAKIAEVTPEHIAGFGDTYSPEDFTPEALDRLLQEEPPEAVPIAAEPEPIAPEAEEPEPEKAPETPATVSADDPLRDLRMKYQEKSNELNTTNQKLKHYEELLSDPAKARDFFVKKKGVSSEELQKLFVRDADGKVDMFNEKNQSALLEAQRVLAEEQGDLRRANEELRKKLAHQEQMENLTRTYSQLDRELSRTGAEDAMGEAFSDADRKWAQIHTELGAEMATRFVMDPALQKQYPHLEAPKNFDAYVRVNKAISARRHLPDADLAVLLTSMGVAPTTKKPAVDPKNLAPATHKNQVPPADVATLPPAGAGATIPNNVADAEAFLRSIEGKAKLSKEEAAKLDAILRDGG